MLILLQLQQRLEPIAICQARQQSPETIMSLKQNPKYTLPFNPKLPNGSNLKLNN